MKIIYSTLLLLFCFQIQAQETVPFKLYEELKKEFDDYKKENAVSATEMAQLKTELNTLKIYKSNVTGKTETLNGQIADLKKQLEAANKSTQKLTKEKEELKTKLDKQKVNAGNNQNLSSKITNLENKIKKLEEKNKNLDARITTLKKSTGANSVKNLQKQLADQKAKYIKDIDTKNEKIKKLERTINAYGNIKVLVDGAVENAKTEVQGSADGMLTFLKQTGTNLDIENLDEHINSVLELSDEADIYISAVGSENKEVRDKMKAVNTKLINYVNTLQLLKDYKRQLSKKYNTAEINTLINSRAATLKDVPNEAKDAKKIIVKSLDQYEELLKKYCVAHNETSDAFVKVMDAFSLSVKTTTLKEIEIKFKDYPYITELIKTNKDAFLGETIDKNPLTKVSCN